LGAIGKEIKGFLLKVARNSLCPCGSGRKYKHCCLRLPNTLPLERQGAQIDKKEFSGDDLCVTYYVVCMVDILGQKERLGGWTNLPEGSTLPANVVQALKETVGTIRSFRSAFEQYFDEAARSTIPQEALSELPREQQEKYGRFRDCRLATQQFGDTFVFYAPVGNVHGDASVVSFYRILGACCYAMLLSLAVGVPVRGGLCIGTGMELEHCNFYGPGLAEAHVLESRVAQYPRVVVSEAAVEFIGASQRYSDDSEMQVMMARLAGLSRAQISRDDDGRAIVDFLGEGTRSIVGQDDAQIEKLVGKAYQFVREEKVRFLSQGNVELTERYTRLQKYLESRIGLWGVQPGA